MRKRRKYLLRAGILYFDAILNKKNQPLASVHFSNNKASDNQEHYSLSQLTDGSLEALFAVIINAFLFILRFSFVK